MANVDQRRALVDKVVASFGDGLPERHFALSGVVFRPGADDPRHAPNRASMHELLRRGAAIRVCDMVEPSRSGASSARFAHVSTRVGSAPVKWPWTQTGKVPQACIHQT
ncbi:MAG: hypothetical protein HT579_19660 [Candidatus Accumulibacter similis]|nr:MAG: hypothetical protein HT579_19660 [Candidatus Accumulibacter similis]